MEPRKIPSTEWYSHKHNGPGLSYELAISIYSSNLVWINGPFWAGKSDLEIFRIENGLKDKIPAGKKLIGDSGYKGEPEIISISNNLDNNAVKEFKRRARAHHETFNGRIKKFKILREKFRHKLEDHKTFFEAACVIMQYEMENGCPLFDL